MHNQVVNTDTYNIQRKKRKKERKMAERKNRWHSCPYNLKNDLIITWKECTTIQHCKPSKVVSLASIMRFKFNEEKQTNEIKTPPTLTNIRALIKKWSDKEKSYIKEH